MIKYVGPFRVYYVPNQQIVDVSLKMLGDWPVGWEYGWRDEHRAGDKPWVDVRIGKLQVLYFERLKWGFEAWVLGFWWIC